LVGVFFFLVQVAAAKAAGVKNVDVYLFPCPSQPAAEQVAAMWRGLADVEWDFLWLDIETNPSRGCGWGNDTAANCKFVDEMLNSAAGLGVGTGVYTSHFEWGATVGQGCRSASALPLWYAGYDKPPNPSCTDFQTFGGWPRAYAHQYADTATGVPAQCGLPAADSSVVC